MSSILDTFEESFGAQRIRQQESMRDHTAFKIGGPAEYYIDVDKTEDLVKAVLTARKLGIPVFVFGGGTNIVVSDEGILGLVIKNNCRRFEVASMKGTIKNRALDVSYALIFAEAGVLMNQLVRFSIDQGLSGLEYSLGLPGTVGGAVYMNANYPKKNILVGDSVYSVKVLTKTGEIVELNRQQLGFAFNKSSLQETGDIILSVLFTCVPSDKTLLWEKGTEAVTYRNETSPKGSTGGFTFRNIGISQAMSIQTPGNSTSPSYLIEQAGMKGRRVGDAEISDVNPNYIVNMGHATASDVLALVQLVKDEVFKKFHVQLLLDVKVIGERD